MQKPVYQKLRLDAIHPDPRNPRKHTKGNLATIKMCLADFGQYRPILVNANTNAIIAGHGLYQAMLDLGWVEADCALIDAEDQESISLMITDNRCGELADWDIPKLCRQLQSVGDIGMFGYSEGDLHKLMEKMDDGAGGEEPLTRTIVCPKCSHHFTRKATSGNSKSTTEPTAARSR